MTIDLGTAAVMGRKRVVAGSYQTVTYRYRAGHPVDDTGSLKIAFRYAGDFGTPQFDRPADANFCSVSTSGDCRIEPRWDTKGHTRPWGKCLYLKVMGGYLDKGETVTVVFGDTSRGSRGWQMQTFTEESLELKTLVDPFATFRFKELPVSPVLRVVPGKPVRAVCLCPSQVRINERFAFHVRLEDEWGNATRKARRRVHAGFDTAGITTFAARDAGTGLEADSNPVHVLAPDAAGTLPRWWADLHGQSEETIGSNSIDAYFRYARDCAKIDVLGHQGNDFQVTDTFWDTINRTTRAYNNPGEFVTFPGYEWSGNTPLGGDRNVYFKREGGAIRHSSHDLLPGGTSRYAISPTADDLFDDLAGPEPFVFAHVGGRYADMSMHREGMEAAVEVHSAWGTFEWLVEDALKRGYRVGICANSDGHKGRPGASYPGASRFGSLGGLTCVLAAKLDRAHVHDAIMRRHVYATTGNRPYLDVAVTTADGRSAMMGDVIAAGDGDALLRVRVFGTGAINNVEVRNGLERLKTLRPYRRRDLGPRLRVVWSGAEVKGRARKVAWDGGLSLRGNRIRGVVPVNFWNPMRPLRQLGRNRLRWQSITTGGLAGVILELERPRAGSLAVDTLQKSCCCELGSLGMAPRVYRAGGVHKQIQVSRLPREGKREYAFTCPLPDLRPGDNPIYVRVEQEDGHMAWSSPVYVVR